MSPQLAAVCVAQFGMKQLAALRSWCGASVATRPRNPPLGHIAAPVVLERAKVTCVGESISWLALPLFVSVFILKSTNIGCLVLAFFCFKHRVSSKLPLA